MTSLKEVQDFHFEMYEDENGKTWYRLIEPIVYKSHRFNKTATAQPGEISDGATGPATDIVSKSWFTHDHLRKTRKWDDGTECTNYQASWVIYDILMKEKRWFRAGAWFVATLGWGWIIDKITNKEKGR